MRKTTVVRGSFLLRLRVLADGTWAGEVEQIATGRKETFRSQQQMLERLTAMVTGSVPNSETPEKVGEG